MPNIQRMLALSLIVGLGGTACGGGAHTVAEKQPAAKRQASLPEVPPVQIQYFANGSREIIFDKVFDSNALSDSNSYSGQLFPTNIFEWCDGGDLVEEGLGYDDRQGQIATSISRTIGYRACRDGRLTPADFKPSPAEEVLEPRGEKR